MQFRAELEIAVNNADPSGHFVVAAIDTIWDAIDLYSDVRDCFGDSDSMACAMLPIDALAVVALSAEGPSNNVARKAAKAADAGEAGLDVGRRVDDVDVVDLRRAQGTVMGRQDAPYVTGQWLRGSERNAGRIPQQIAERLRGQTFESFDDFRGAFWKAVADDPDLSRQFSLSNRRRMALGKAPFASKSQQVGRGFAQKVYNLHHIQPIWAGGAVYDLDNIIVVSPRYHQEVLVPWYHYNW